MAHEQIQPHFFPVVFIKMMPVAGFIYLVGEVLNGGGHSEKPG
jgi:hypothetical protein